jgi:polysaccharide export outer membrane protein
MFNRSIRRLPASATFRGLRLLRCGMVALVVASSLSACATPHYSDMLAGAAYAPYNLSAGDKLRVLVFGQDNLSNIYVVDGAGRISMPLIGVVPAAGMTTTALEGAVGERLRNGFIREPHVSIQVEQYRPFFVLGEVTQSGQFPYVSGMTVQTAIAIAGGFSPRAERDGVEVTRRFGDHIITGYVPMTYPLKPGDTVTVKERWF